VIQRIAEYADKHRPYHLSIDLENQTVSDDFGLTKNFAIDAFRRHRLLNGLDEIGMTLAHEADISCFEREHQTCANQG